MQKSCFISRSVINIFIYIIDIMNHEYLASVDYGGATSEHQTMQSPDKMLALQTLDEKSMRLQETGKYTEALAYMEKALILRQHLFGPTSDQFWTACKTISETCNLLAMGYLQQSDFPAALELLRKAELLTERDDKARAVTLNNFACYYRRNGNLNKASRYLKEALRLEIQLIDQQPSRADTHLNMCAVLSEMGRHQNALHHAQSALVLLHEELHQSEMDGEFASTTRSGSSHDRVAVLGIAYHNAGVEQEFLKRLEASIQSYNKGLEYTEQWLGTKHGIVLTLRRSLDQAQQRLTSTPGGKRCGEAEKSLKYNCTSKTRKFVSHTIRSSRSRSQNARTSHSSHKRNSLMVVHT